MKIEAGKYYRDGSGKVRGPATPYNDAKFKWQLGAYYTDAGGYYSDNRDSPHNLVCEVECRDVLPFPLEAGAKYNTTKPDGTPGPVVKLAESSWRKMFKIHYPFLVCEDEGKSVNTLGEVFRSDFSEAVYHITSPYVAPKPPTIAERLEKWRTKGGDLDAIIAAIRELEATK